MNGDSRMEGHRRADDQLLLALRDKIEQAYALSNTLAIKLADHQTECRDRYDRLQKSVDGILDVLKWVAGTLLVGMMGMLVSMVAFRGSP